MCRETLPRLLREVGPCRADLSHGDRTACSLTPKPWEHGALWLGTWFQAPAWHVRGELGFGTRLQTTS